MSNDVSQPLSMPSNRVIQLESMGFGTNQSLQQQIPLNMPTGQMGSALNDVGSQLISLSNRHTRQIEPQAYAQLPQQYIIPNKPVREMIPTMLDALRPHQLPILSKRKTPMEPLSPNSVPQKLSVPNNRVAEMEHRPWLQPISTPSKRAAQLLSFSNTVGSQPSPASNKRSVPNKIGLSAPRNQPSLMRTSLKLQTEPFESVRSKMRESLAGALVLVSQQQGVSSKAEKDSNGEAMCSPGKTQESSNPVNSNSGNADAACSTSGEPQRALISICEGAADRNINNTAQTLKCDGQQFHSGNLLPDVDVPFSDNIFASDDLLQGNGLSWVLEPEIALAEKKEIETDGKRNPDNEKMREGDLGKSLPSPQVLASQIEAELFKLFGGVNKKYKEKGRSLLFNLKDRNNPELRERVVSGEISPERICSMSAEELASKELSEWRLAKAEELAQMVVLPDIEVDIRRLVKKTHKGEFQVEVVETDGASVEVSGGTLISRRPKTEAKQAPTTGKTVGKKEEFYTTGEKSNLEDPNLTVSIPSSEDPMQGLMGEDELKDADFLPPIVSLDEFMQSLDSEPPFNNLPGDAGKAASPSVKDDSEARSDSKSTGRVSQDSVDATPDKHECVNASNVKSEAEVKPNDTPAKEETIDSVVTLKGEHVWEGSVQLNITTTASVIGTFKSGEKTSTKIWPSSLEIKGRVRLDAFEKFLQDLHKSRSRAVMVIHFVCKEGSTESERRSLVEAADFYVLDGRVGFAEPTSGVELYLCPPHAKTHGMLTNILPKDQVEALNAIDNGLIGVVVWRRAQLISHNSTSSHHKHTSRKQHFSSTRRHQEKDSKLEANFPSKPTHSHPLTTLPNEVADDGDCDDDDDDVPPGFGPASATSGDEDDLPEFNFSGGSNPSARSGYPVGTGMEMASSRLYSSQTSTRPVDQMRELVQKYGQPNSNRSLGVSMQPWNDDDDDDIPEWQPQPQTQVHRYEQQPVHAALQLPHQPLQSMHVHGQQNVSQSLQQQQQQQVETWWVPPTVSQGQPFVNELQYYGLPAWRKDGPNSRGF